jgi:hypothetical protein
MDFMLDFEPAKLSHSINYHDKLLLVGSCFTEHIGKALSDAKIAMLQNPNGILFDPLSVCNSLESYIADKKYSSADLFLLNEVWQSWHHHSRFSGIDSDAVVQAINHSQDTAHEFLKTADWIIITLGSAFSYRLTPEAAISWQGRQDEQGQAVANCHRAPAQWFNKHLLPIHEIVERLDGCVHRLFQFNPDVEILFTVSPVRHLRDGVVENNRSKARLIEAVHQMVNKFERLHYFPAYELVIDVLRDYRFYDIDLAHPNYLATDYVLQKFINACLDAESITFMSEMKKLSTARKHKAFHPATAAHRRFLDLFAGKTRELQAKYPGIDLSEELTYFSSY